MAKVATGNIGWSGFMWRWLLALVIVLGTFNPTPYSYFNWVVAGFGDLPLKVLVGIVIVALFALYMRATWYSIGCFGVVLSASFFGALIWVLVYYDILDTLSGTVMTWIGLVIIATIMAIGMSFSFVRRRISGQVDVDDVET